MRPGGAFLGPSINADGALRPDANSVLSVYRYNVHNFFNASQEGQWWPAGSFKPKGMITGNALVIAGGGATLSSFGGGGAGGLVYYGPNTTPKTPNGDYIEFAVGETLVITVGAGGTSGSNGANSNIVGAWVNVTAQGGGNAYSYYGANGASGGGAYGTGIGYGIDGQGFNGGIGTIVPAGGASSGGGGGGAGGLGGDGGYYGSPPGVGGIGLPYNITGTNTIYASGGAGTGSGGPLSATPGGGGASNSDGTQNTGGGAGGGTQSGGSGVVVIAYPGEQAAYGGQIVTSNVNIEGTNCTVHVFNTSGTLLVLDPAAVAANAAFVPQWQTASGNIGANTAGAPVTFSVAATDADTYSLVSGSLPNGMTLNESNGYITGTPTGTDVTDYSNTTFSFQISASNEYGPNIRGFSIKLESRYVGYLCGTTGEGGSITLTAPEGFVINRKDFSHYGTLSGSCPTYVRGGCSSGGAAAWAPTLPAASVTFTASNGVWGDPCGGTAKAGALVVSYGYF